MKKFWSDSHTWLFLLPTINAPHNLPGQVGLRHGLAVFINCAVVGISKNGLVQPMDVQSGMGESFSWSCAMLPLHFTPLWSLLLCSIWTYLYCKGAVNLAVVWSGERSRKFWPTITVHTGKRLVTRVLQPFEKQGCTFLFLLKTVWIMLPTWKKC